MEIRFLDVPEQLPPDFVQKLAYLRQHLSFRQVYAHYGFRWLSDDSHQLSCPFHAKNTDAGGQPVERNPSARFYKATNSVYCFACSDWWDALRFIQKREGFGVQRALDFVSGKLGVDVGKVDFSFHVAEAKRADTDDETAERGTLLVAASDDINDRLDQLRRLASRPEVLEALERAEISIFKRRIASIDNGRHAFTNYKRMLEEWRDWGLVLIRETWVNSRP